MEGKTIHIYWITDPHDIMQLDVLMCNKICMHWHVISAHKHSFVYWLAIATYVWFLRRVLPIDVYIADYKLLTYRVFLYVWVICFFQTQKILSPHLRLWEANYNNDKVRRCHLMQSETETKFAVVDRVKRKEKEAYALAIILLLNSGGVMTESDLSLIHIWRCRRRG